MAWNTDDLFDPLSYTAGAPVDNSNRWYIGAFERAYCHRIDSDGTMSLGPFARVIERLASGFSVLVYLPGTCMNAAATYVRDKISADWYEYGKYPAADGDAQTTQVSLEDVFRQASGGLVSRIHRWFKSPCGRRPSAVYHNLDMLSDQDGRVNQNLSALTALFALIEATRSGIVLGLADRKAGQLPPQIQRAFDETIWLGDIEYGTFSRLIPVTLGEQLAENGRLGDMPAWLIASRLRATDPIRAVKIMSTVARSITGGNLEDRLGYVLDKIWQATRPVGFEAPPRAYGRRIDGFERQTMEVLETEIVKPYQSWRRFSGTSGGVQQCERMLGQLPSGVILHGPAGTGKTHLARWLAGQIELPTRIVSAATIKASGWGDAERNIHHLFLEARQAAPCMLVFDDADDLFPDRELATGSVAAGERGVVDAALQELDGFLRQPAGVLVVLTTNRYAMLDHAIKSRFDVHLRIPYPLTREQVDQIIGNFANEYGAELSDEIRCLLRERFFDPLSPTTFQGDVESADARREAERGFFSAREIKQAMRRLLTAAGNASPNAHAFQTMTRYYGEWKPRKPPRAAGAQLNEQRHA